MDLMVASACVVSRSMCAVQPHAGLRRGALLLQIRSLATRVLASIKEMAEAAAPQPMTTEQQCMVLPSVGCWSPRCRNMATPAEDTLSMRKCAKCGVAKYCCAACQKAHWKAHKAACKSRQ